MLKTYTAHKDLVDRVQNTYEYFDRKHSTIAIGSAAILLHLYDSGIDISSSPVLMDVPDTDALANEYFIGQLYDDLKEGNYPDGFQFELFGPNNSNATGYDTDGIRVADAAADLSLPFEAFPKYNDSSHGIDINSARNTAMTRGNGQLIMPMREIITWKLSVGRPRDLAYCAELLNVLRANDYLLPENQQELEAPLKSKMQ